MIEEISTRLEDVDDGGMMAVGHDGRVCWGAPGLKADEIVI